MRFDDLGLLWLECKPSPSQFENELAEECLGVTKTNWNDIDPSPFGVSFDPPDGGLSGRRLVIGNDVYEAVHHPYAKTSLSNPGGAYEFRLSKNGELLLTLTSPFGAYDPNINLLNLDGKYAWEFANPNRPTVIYDGVDMSKKLDLEASYRPWVIRERLIFVTEKNEMMFITFDSETIGPVFDRIYTGGYCCESHHFIDRRPGQYWFWGQRDNEVFLILIAENHSGLSQ